MIRKSSFIVLLAALSPVFCLAQGTPAPASPPASEQTTPADPKSPTPPPAPTQKPKTVWTNDNVKSAGNVSVVGDQRNQKYTMTKPPDPALVAKYRASLQKMQEQLADVNKQLQAYEDFEEGKPVSEGGRDYSKGYSRTPVSQQAAKLLDKRKKLEGDIDALFEEARKKGVESGLLK